MSTVHVHHDPPMHADQLHLVRARNAEGVNAVEINLRFAPGTPTFDILNLLSSAMKEISAIAVRAQHPSRESEGSRWHG